MIPHTDTRVIAEQMFTNTTKLLFQKALAMFIPKIIFECSLSPHFCQHFITSVGWVKYGQF